MPTKAIELHHLLGISSSCIKELQLTAMMIEKEVFGSFEKRNANGPLHETDDAVELPPQVNKPLQPGNQIKLSEEAPFSIIKPPQSDNQKKLQPESKKKLQPYNQNELHEKATSPINPKSSGHTNTKKAKRKMSEANNNPNKKEIIRKRKKKL
jgi:hypothetical protein